RREPRGRGRRRPLRRGLDKAGLGDAARWRRNPDRGNGARGCANTAARALPTTACDADRRLSRDRGAHRANEQLGQPDCGRVTMSMWESVTGYTFRSALLHDLPMLERWLRTPEVVRWWGDPDEQAALLQQDLDEPAMVMRIVS